MVIHRYVQSEYSFTTLFNLRRKYSSRTIYLPYFSQLCAPVVIVLGYNLFGSTVFCELHIADIS